MILPKKQKDPDKKYVAIATAVLVCLFGYAALTFSSIKDPDSAKLIMSEYTQIDLTKFQPPAEKPKEIEESTSQEESQVETEEPENEVETPKKVDLSEVLPGGITTDLSEDQNPTSSTPQSRTTESDQPSSLRLNETEVEDIGGLNTLAGDEMSAVNSLNARSSNSVDGASGSGLSISENADNSPGRAGISADGSGDSKLSRPEVRDGNGKGTEVGLKDLSEFGENYSELEPMFEGLVEWMKQNPADLPVPVKRVMEDGRWEPSFLTSRVTFHTDDRNFDLLLMVKEDLLEVHIFLVENNDATYLIDRGFQKDPNYLRVGSVGLSNNEIAEVDSRMESAGKQRTEKFYQIFQSWWDTVKHEVEQ